ncbi:MAG TPA: DinB family protein [Candidatus Limnocylindria bacterium]|nr:DinB family protein [Candidatus Limnocylindria bacterium]
MTDGTLLRAVRHNCWANAELIAFCGRLSPERLGWSAPGTYGSIHRILHHIVGAEHGYLFRLTGHRPPIEEERGGRAMTPDWTAPLDELAERARSNAERMEALLAGDFDPGRVTESPAGGGRLAAAGIVVAQFIHHGSDHRAHVGTILGANGVEPPRLDVWAYGASTGEVPNL